MGELCWCSCACSIPKGRRGEIEGQLAIYRGLWCAGVWYEIALGMAQNGKCYCNPARHMPDSLYVFQIQLSLTCWMSRYVRI